jgi:hypothetical protein
MNEWMRRYDRRSIKTKESLIGFDFRIVVGSVMSVCIFLSKTPAHTGTTLYKEGMYHRTYRALLQQPQIIVVGILMILSLIVYIGLS